MDEKKRCPFDSEIGCGDCRLYVLSGVMGDAVLRCVFDLIRGALQQAVLAQIGGVRQT